MRKRLISMIAVLSLLAALCTGAAFAADEAENASNYEIGDIVTYGNYEQDGFYSNGEETIEWIVIARDRDNHALLLSRYCLDALPYNATGKKQHVLLQTQAEDDLQAGLLLRP